MNDQLVEYVSTHIDNDRYPLNWTELRYDIPFKSLRMGSFNLRINGEVFCALSDAGFEEKYNNAMFWLRLTA